jgi:hypothetical protein
MPEHEGTPWTRREIEAIVADYLEMLMIELAGGMFVKAERNRALQALTGRSHGSIEYKHQNISAVMAEFGLPFVRGYKPAKNYQRALFEAVDSHLSARGLHDRLASTASMDDISRAELEFQSPPPLSARPKNIDPDIQSLIRRYDPAIRDARARALGEAGESFVFHAEQNRLSAIGRDDLASKVRWVAKEDGDGAGFDILSFSKRGKERWLEVKTTNGPSTTPFWISENERRVAERNPQVFRLTRLFDFARRPTAFNLKPPLSDHVRLIPSQYRATF